MNQPNYGDAAPAYTPPDSADDGLRKVKVQPFQLLQRAHQLTGDQFWLFVGITFVGMILASLVPLGILMGPMLIGIYYCFMDREIGRPAAFDTLFKGFEQFAESVIAILIMLGFSFAVMLPLCFLLFLLIVIPAVAAADGGGNPPPSLIAGVVLFYPLIILASIFVYVPFLFTFQLIADRKLKAWDAVRLSARGVWGNLGGVLLHMFVLSVCSFFLTLMCYVPAIIFMPLALGSLFMLYRDIYGMAVIDAEIVT